MACENATKTKTHTLIYDILWGAFRGPNMECVWDQQTQIAQQSKPPTLTVDDDRSIKWLSNGFRPMKNMIDKNSQGFRSGTISQGFGSRLRVWVARMGLQTHAARWDRLLQSQLGLSVSEVPARSLRVPPPHPSRTADTPRSMPGRPDAPCTGRPSPPPFQNHRDRVQRPPYNTPRIRCAPQRRVNERSDSVGATPRVLLPPSAALWSPRRASGRDDRTERVGPSRPKG